MVPLPARKLRVIYCGRRVFTSVCSVIRRVRSTTSSATRDWLTRTVQIPGKVGKRLGVFGKFCFLTVGKA